MTPTEKTIIVNQLLEKYRTLLNEGMNSCHGDISLQGCSIHFIAVQLEILQTTIEMITSQDPTYPIQLAKARERFRVSGCAPIIMSKPKEEPHG
jgi:hypothetical protein